MTTAANGAWYVLLTAPQRELQATSGLIGRRFHAYCPTYHVRVSHGRQQTRVVDRPCFNGYAFVNLSAGGDRFDRVRAVPGVKDFFKVNGTPRKLFDWELDLIRSVEEYLDGRFQQDERRLQMVDDASQFEIGQLVEIAGGPLALLDKLLTGTVERIDKNGQIRLSIAELGRMSSVTVTASQIRAA